MPVPLFAAPHFAVMPLLPEQPMLNPPPKGRLMVPLSYASEFWIVYFFYSHFACYENEQNDQQARVGCYVKSNVV